MFDGARKKYPPKDYFSGRELAVAEAIYYDNKRQLVKLLDNGLYPINAIGQGGLTYLMYAIFIENYDMAELLLKQGADPNQVSPWVLYRNLFLREDGSVWPIDVLPLSTCCEPGYQIKWMKLLVKHGADLNDNRAKTPLEVAITAKDVEKVEYLLDCGANINQTYQSYTPVMIAAMVLNWDMVNYLLDRGADVFQVNRNGYTLGLYLQEHIDRGVAAPEWLARVQALIDRLKEKGVEFPIERQEGNE